MKPRCKTASPFFGSNAGAALRIVGRCVSLDFGILQHPHDPAIRFRQANLSSREFQFDAIGPVAGNQEGSGNDRPITSERPVCWMVP